MSAGGRGSRMPRRRARKGRPFPHRPWLEGSSRDHRTLTVLDLDRLLAEDGDVGHDREWIVPLDVHHEGDPVVGIPFVRAVWRDVVDVYVRRTDDARLALADEERLPL